MCGLKLKVLLTEGFPYNTAYLFQCATQGAYSRYLLSVMMLLKYWQAPGYNHSKVSEEEEKCNTVSKPFVAQSSLLRFRIDSVVTLIYSAILGRKLKWASLRIMLCNQDPKQRKL